MAEQSSSSFQESPSAVANRAEFNSCGRRRWHSLYDGRAGVLACTALRCTPSVVGIVLVQYRYSAVHEPGAPAVVRTVRGTHGAVVDALKPEATVCSPGRSQKKKLEGAEQKFYIDLALLLFLVIKKYVSLK